MFRGSKTISLDDNDPLLTPRHKYLGEKAFHLRVVEEFLTQMELSLLKTASEPFDFSSVRSAMTELRALADDENPDKRKRTEFQLAHELLLWQENLAERDEKIEAYHIRRYCDGLRKAFDSEVFVALARFYRDIPRSKNSQSKFDLALTRAFSVSISDIYRSMSLSRDEISIRLTALYCAWDRVRTIDAGSPRDVSGFDKFIAENDELADFRSLTDSKLFDRIREYKTELGEKFWGPKVAAAAVECNIVVGNHLNGLMARASENLGERLGSEFDFGGAFQDTSENTGTYLSEALREIGEESPELLPDLEEESDDLRFLRSLFELSGSLQAESDAEASEEPVDHESVEVPAALSIDEPAFKELLSVLDQHNPDLRPLAAYAASAGLGAEFGLDDFLFSEDHQPDEVGREVLSAIFVLESFRKNELHERKTLSVLIRNRVMHHLAQAEELGGKIENAIAERPESAGRRLKLANRLLEARLRTERSIVKFTSRGLGEVIAKRDEIEELDFEKPTIGPLNYASTSANKWLVAFTVAVMVISGILYFSTGNAAGSESADDVEMLEAVRLPGGKGMASAYREGNTLYLVATDGWRKRPIGEKTEALKDLITTSAKKPIFRVLVLGEDGTPLGEMSSDNGVTIAEEPQAPQS